LGFDELAKQLQQQEFATRFPRPLACTCKRFIKELRGSEPVSAVWALRDAWEAGIKFVACLGIADLKQAGVRGDKIECAVTLLFKPSGLSLGDWVGLLAVGCDGSMERRRRLLRGLASLYKDDGRLTEVGKALSGTKNSISLVDWRNRIFGHGVFKEDHQGYEEETLTWAKPLLDFYNKLEPIFAEWTLRDGGPTGLPLTGAEDADANAHEDVSADRPDELVLTGPLGTLRFGPLLTAQRCAVCGGRHIFFYDSSKHGKDRPLRTKLMEYCSTSAPLRQREVFK
jgi:hypothetical protein